MLSNFAILNPTYDGQRWERTAQPLMIMQLFHNVRPEESAPSDIFPQSTPARGHSSSSSRCCSPLSVSSCTVLQLLCWITLHLLNTTRVLYCQCTKQNKQLYKKPCSGPTGVSCVRQVVCGRTIILKKKCDQNWSLLKIQSRTKSTRRPACVPERWAFYVKSRLSLAVQFFSKKSNENFQTNWLAEAEPIVREALPSAGLRALLPWGFLRQLWGVCGRTTILKRKWWEWKSYLI